MYIVHGVKDTTPSVIYNKIKSHASEMNLPQHEGVTCPNDVKGMQPKDGSIMILMEIMTLSTCRQVSLD